MPILLVSLLALAVGGAQSEIRNSKSAIGYTFELARPAEVALVMRASAPGTSWREPGAEQATVRLDVDGQYSQHLTLFQGAIEHDYRVLLGPLKAGRHRLAAAFEPKMSSPAARGFTASFRIAVFEPGHPEYEAICRAPFIWARPDTIGRATDVPLISYYEWLPADGDRPPTAGPPPPGAARVLQYTCIFSNEDGGTNTPALLARWGRTVDIEHVYRVFFDVSGKLIAELFQGVKHKETPFAGRRVGLHPVYGVASNNNNFSDQPTSQVRLAPWPQAADLRSHSRESLLDSNSWAYRVMAEELEREGKFKEVADPRKYLYVEARVATAAAGATFGARLKDGREFRADAGRADRRIERSGWVRASIELPDGARPGDVTQLLFYCGEPAKPPAPAPPDRFCSIEAIGKAFMLDRDYRPGQFRSFTGPLPARLALSASAIFAAATE